MAIDRERIMRKAAQAPDRSFRVATNLSLPEADLIRTCLASIGIPSSLENASVVGWFWHYSVAVGGVRLCVLGSDVKRAFEFLEQGNPDDPLVASTDRPENLCENCGAEKPANWEVCWNCFDTDELNESASTTFDDSETDGQQPSMFMALCVFVSVALFVLTEASIALLVVACIALVAHAWLRHQETRLCEQGDIDADTDVADSSTR